MSTRVFARLTVPLLTALALGCGGSEKAPREPLAPPPVSPALTVHVQGSFALEIAASASQHIDPRALASQAGVTPDCSKAVVLLSWRTAGSRAVKVVATTDRGEVTAGDGSEGVTSIPGCETIRIQNDGNNAVTGEARYVLAQNP